MKVNESVRCPYCGKEKFYVFHLGNKMLECESCNKPFDIRTKTIVTVIGEIPIRECCVCEEKFESYNVYGEKIKCPKCGFETDNYK